MTALPPQGQVPCPTIEMRAGELEPTFYASSMMLVGESAAPPSLAEGDASGDSQLNNTALLTGNAESLEHAHVGEREPPDRLPARRGTIASSFLAFLDALSPTFLLLLLLTFAVMLLLLYMQVWKSKQYLRHKT